MKKEDIIKFCKYFKGEEQNPFADNSKKSVFWDCERLYVENTIHDEAFHKDWVEEAKHYIHTHSSENNTLTSKEISIETKGIILYIESMLMKWKPYKIDLVLDY